MVTRLEVLQRLAEAARPRAAGPLDRLPGLAKALLPALPLRGPALTNSVGLAEPQRRPTTTR